MDNFYLEPQQQVKIYDSCDILIVGGGAAGHSAAVAAARAGAEDIVILERYGYFGGDATGDYVLMVPAMSWLDHSMVRGLQEEWFTRIEKNAPDCITGPALKDIGKRDAHLLDRWQGIHGCVNMDPKDRYIVRAPYFEPTALKLEMDAMVQELPQIRIIFHGWGTKPIMDGNEVKGVIFESKEGRQAIMAKIVIDATGDGDIFAQAGAPFETRPVSNDSEARRDNETALVWRMGGVDFQAYYRWRQAHPEAYRAFADEVNKMSGFRTMCFPAGKNDVVWWNNWLSGKSCIDLKDMRDTELSVRNSVRKVTEFCREMVPEAFRDAFIYDISPQLGCRCSRRLKGEYYYTMLDIAAYNEFDDVIAWHSTVASTVPIEIPYRTIVPQKIENLLAPGRHASADNVAITALQLIPQCIATGQAAGVASAIALKDGTTVRNVDIKKVQKILAYDQDVPLPRMDNTDQSIVEDLKACNYGRDTERNKAIRAKAGLDW